MKTGIGIMPKNTLEVSKALNRLLADEHVLYIKTRNAHWNVEGDNFHALHVFFENQYKQLEDIIDEVAERIRSLGHYAEGTMGGFLNLTHLVEKGTPKNDSLGFISALLKDHETIIVHLRGIIDRVANQWSDLGTSDFMTGLMETHEKMAWMLRAHLK